eukprot:CAMPEP_0179449674 /NCGR_PEP_ID=MMETSP0799-20121207/33563_1 /TAXON_ID=46947 /ORGANISM="Geminigera cryophila, Strain CCMP2564" /LENGTH=405 /DNA_ID=CAMNT_0021242839 /DNA_START=96 /DNA_END=1314 /DNA_ORIENTATION=+
MGRKLSAARPDKPVPAGDDYYKIVSILKEKRVEGKKQYLIKWQGCKKRTWEPTKNVTKDNIVEWACKHREESIAKWVRKRSKERATRRAAVQAEKNKSGNSVGTLNRATDQCSISIISVAVQSGAQQTHARKKRKATEIAVPSREGMDGQRNVGSVLSERSQAALGCSSQQDAFAAAAPVAATSSDGAQTKRVRFANDSPAVVEELQEKFSAMIIAGREANTKRLPTKLASNISKDWACRNYPLRWRPQGLVAGRRKAWWCLHTSCCLYGHPGASSHKPAEGLFNQVSAEGLEIYKSLKGRKRTGEEADAYRLAYTHLLPSPGPPSMHCDVGKEKGQSSSAGARANHHPLPSVARMQGGDLIFVRISRIEEENRQTQQRIAELQDDVKELKAVIAELHNKSTHCQ